VKEHPDLMEAADEKGRTPMHIAIVLRRRHIITAMIDALEEIDKALRIQDGTGRNCLHVAVTSRLPSQLVVSLIQRASEQTLCGQDKDGLTPLHAAVSFDLCTASQLEVVRELLKRSTSPLGIVMEKPDMFSPYQYHVFTRGKSMIVAPRAAEEKSPRHLMMATAAKEKVTLPSLPRKGKRRPTRQSMVPIWQTAKLIEEELKMAVLRTRGQEEAKRTLYGHNPDSKLTFLVALFYVSDEI